MILLLLAATAHAQYGAHAAVETPLPGAELDPSASATEVEARASTGPRTTEELMLEVPGARVSSLGAFGAFQALSLRGAESDHTTVLLGEIPIGPVDGGAFDLGTIPSSLLERVEVYRGGAPAWLGAPAIGGVLRLVPRASDDDFAEARLGVGSFGFATVEASAAAGSRHVRSLALVGVVHSDGDFPYRGDGGTPLDPSDDGDVRRGNASLTQGHGLAHLHVDVGDYALELVALGVGRTGGLPGPAVQPTRDTRTSSSRSTFVARLSRGDEAAETRFAISAAFGHEARRITDRLGEIGLAARATDDLGLRGALNGAFSHRFAHFFELALVGRGNVERFDPEDALAAMPNQPSTRSSGGAGIEGIFRARPFDKRFEIRPSARIDVAHSALIETRAERAGQASEATQSAPSARLGAVLEITRGVALASSLAYATRLPTFAELFGDRGYLLGDTRLRPEHAWNVDLSLTARGKVGVARGSGELRGFVSVARDLVRYARTSQYTSVPTNEEGARILGVEAGGKVVLFRALTATGSLTALDTQTGMDRELALRPSLEAYGRVELRAIDGLFDVLSDASLYVEAAHLGPNFADAANLVVLPGRTRFGCGATLSILRDRVELALSVRDLFDARGVDVLGFPLPGRSFSAFLTLREGR